jgi:hypothetical protein
MSAIDLLAIAVTTYGIWRRRQFKASRRSSASRIGVWLITLAPLFICLFYYADLIVMNVLPVITSTQDAMAVMDALHLVLCVALLITAGSLIFRTAIVQFHCSRFRSLDGRRTALVTVLMGAVLGVLVTISSVGAGAVGVVALIILYHLRMARIVASDIAHAVLLTLIAGSGHWLIGTVDRHIVGSPDRYPTSLSRRPRPGNCAASFASCDPCSRGRKARL